MSIQDDAFDIQRALELSRTKQSPHTYTAWQHFRDWAYELEEDNEQLRYALHAYKTVVKVSRICLACSKSLLNSRTQYCKKCSKKSKSVYGIPDRRR